MKNILHPLTNHAHRIRWGIRILQLVFIALGVVLHKQTPTDPLQVAGIWCVVVLFLLIAEITRRWVVTSELYVLRVAPGLDLQKISLSQRYSLLSLLVLQAAWWLLQPLSGPDQMAWNAFFVFPLPRQWSGLQEITGMGLLLLWVALERWVHALQMHLQGQGPSRLLRFCDGTVGTLILAVQIGYLFHLGLLPFSTLPADGLGYAKLALHSVYAIFLICFLGWVRNYLHHLTAVSTLRSEKALSGS